MHISRKLNAYLNKYTKIDKNDRHARSLIQLNERVILFQLGAAALP